MVLPWFCRRSSGLERDRNLVARFERAPSRSAVQERTAVLVVLFASPKLPLWAVRAGERLHPWRAGVARRQEKVHARQNKPRSIRSSRQLGAFCAEFGKVQEYR